MCYIHVIVYRGHLSTPEVKEKKTSEVIRQYILLNKKVIKKYRVYYLKVKQMKCTSVLLHLYHRGLQKHTLVNTKKNT